MRNAVRLAPQKHVGWVQVKADSVPQFYFPGGKPVPAEVKAAALAKIDELFRAHPEGLAVPAVRELVKQVMHLLQTLPVPFTITGTGCDVSAGQSISLLTIWQFGNLYVALTQ